MLAKVNYYAYLCTINLHTFVSMAGLCPLFNKYFTLWM